MTLVDPSAIEWWVKKKFSFMIENTTGQQKKNCWLSLQLWWTSLTVKDPCCVIRFISGLSNLTPSTFRAWQFFDCVCPVGCAVVLGFHLYDVGANPITLTILRTKCFQTLANALYGIKLSTNENQWFTSWSKKAKLVYGIQDARVMKELSGNVLGHNLSDDYI